MQNVARRRRGDLMLPDTQNREPFVTRSAAALMRLEFEERVAPVENLITEGLTLLCGASKIGKSWFVLSLCCAVSSGRPFLGRKTQQGP
ncbi:MAG: AAA family ATPase, partial [Paludibacteraceae bacterium]|nr:AAA family ATPase [Paludibacteraceae bacterium]